MIILGIDPGTVKCGYGVVQVLQKGRAALGYGIINVPAKLKMPDKLAYIYNEIENVIRQYRPVECAVETAFYGKNIQSALKLGYARGTAIIAAVRGGLHISEFSPKEVKKSVTGKGGASKEQVNYMVKTLLNLNGKEIPLDASDALAIALCASFKPEDDKKRPNSWEDFIRQNPDKLVNL
ncbi:MAG: crossover junction endodeoxyribonuclease RuvC [Ignavibacteriales bacterium]|nr:MAG: crossover junction endodeoxyribonuclease RuvC [Ignavibacteriaceae bacterium]MBW7872608.1 crossover junction endodeoxyribonuclease RuvC [Ignavibacteria bacterium]MCZ2141839.1 crossover junction endodeoxyribonuclease RuvC [Ignavibacteriales bacterium]OQY73843.1 MAG: crossover junction endodeoxyribonuclease RuvC [Ignavibacteriales bacterium UTCHB3]MBV6445006.1 Crossover junction endodeoxyribonuclease RuvC [Ignavibacteriaceae bacterium]